MPKAQNYVNQKRIRSCRWTPFETSKGREGRCLGHGLKASRSRQTIRTHPNRIVPLRSRKSGVSNTIARYFQSCENAAVKSQNPQSISLTSDEISELNNLLISLSLSEAAPDISAVQDAVTNQPPLQEQEEQDPTTTADSTKIPKTNLSTPITIPSPETGLIVQTGPDSQLYNLFEKTKSTDPFLTTLFNEYKRTFLSDYKDHDRNSTSQLTVQGMSLSTSRDNLNLSPAAQIVVLILLLMHYSSEIPKLLVPKVPKDAFMTATSDRPSPFLRPMDKITGVIPVELELGE